MGGFTYDLAHYVNDVNTQNPRIVSDYGRGGSLTANYTYGRGLLDVNATGDSDSTGWLSGTGSSAAPTTGWCLGDGRGNVAQVATGAGDVVTQAVVDPWGAADAGATGWSAPQFGYQSQLSDPGVGLQYLRARWYEPGMGRFISADPVRGSVTDPLTLNRYAYAWSDPVNMSDPSGYWPQWLNTAIQTAANAVITANHAVSSAMSAAGTWVNNNVIQPVVNAVKPGVVAAANWVYANVTGPVISVTAPVVSAAASWLNDNVIKPVAHAVANALMPLAVATAPLALQAATVVGPMVTPLIAAYRSTTAYIQSVTDRVKAVLRTFVCQPMSSAPAPQNIPASDPLKPGENAQTVVGDCWLVSSLNALMETPEGRQWLLSGIKENPSGGYQVRLNIGGTAAWVDVTNPVLGGVTSNGSIGVAALYEAAVANALPKQVLTNGLPGEGAAILGLAPAAPGVVVASPATTAIASGGSVTAKVVVAATGPLFMQPSSVQATANPQASQPNLVSIDVVPDHVYEVVDIQNGWIGLRNPWGTNNVNDKRAQTASGVFYVNQASFNQMFGVVTVSEPPK